MKRTAFLAVIGAAALCGAGALGCAGETSGDGSDGDTNASFPQEALATVTSDAAKLSVAVRTAPEQPPSRGVIAVEYRIAGEDAAPVEGLTLSVVPWMPDMGHGASITPTVTAQGGGRYVISDVELFMPGRWDLRTTISGAAEDSVAPTFQIP
jgi:hypothetical protein